jgi:hypothetical protein
MKNSAQASVVTIGLDIAKNVFQVHGVDGPCPRTWCKKDCLTRPPVARGAPGVAQRAAGGFQGGHR